VGPATGHGFIDHHREGVPVGRGSDLPRVEHLLRLHAEGRPERDGAAHEHRIEGEEALGDAEIRQLRHAEAREVSVRQEDVFRLDVAVDDPKPVHAIAGPRHRIEEGQGARCGQRASVCEQVGEGLRPAEPPSR